MQQKYTPPETGKYIVIEGIDGSGKTTLAHNLVSFFNDIGTKAVYIKEPYNNELIKEVERVKLSEYRNEDEILAALFAADRLMLKDVIGSYMAEGVHVISDRSKYSSYAYQNVDQYWNQLINQYMIDPHVLIYLDLDPEIAKQRYEGDDRFENSVFLAGVREWYLKNLKEEAERNQIHYATYNLNDGATAEDVLEFMKKALVETFEINTQKVNR